MVGMRAPSCHRLLVAAFSTSFPNSSILLSLSHGPASYVERSERHGAEVGNQTPVDIESCDNDNGIGVLVRILASLSRSYLRYCNRRIDRIDVFLLVGRSAYSTYTEFKALNSAVVSQFDCGKASKAARF
jgi:hypothetical protein